MTENKRFIVDDAGTLIDIQTRESYDIVEEVVDLLNQKEEEITFLKSVCMELEDANGRLEERLDYIQNSISNAIKHQKTKIGEKALREVIEDYNEWIVQKLQVLRRV